MNVFKCLIVLTSISLASGGSISGHVCDTSGNPLVGATVMVVGTSFGAMSEPDGEYMIEGLAPGVYSIQARMVGMGERTVEGITVIEGMNTNYDFGGPEFMGYSLQPEVITPDPMSGRILVQREDLTVTDLPLEHTSVAIQVSGNVQQGCVKQVYSNPFDIPIETTYVFPLPDDGAVNKMSVYIGDRLIEGHVYQKEIAEDIYEDAVEEGRTAALLIQERPNVFTQELGNILPGDSITVEITYIAPVNRYENEFEVVFPMVVPPKYIPGNPIAEGERGWSNPTDQVPDADRVNPSVFPEGMRSGYDIDLTVAIDAGIPVHDVISVNHEIITEERSSLVSINLASVETIPNRDFVLRYNLNADPWQAGVLTTNTDTGGHFMLVLRPDADLSVETPAPREYFFVVDCSGSMSGQPMAVAKETMRNFLRNMNSEDTFQIIKFSNTASSFSEAPIPATRRNVNLGLAYVELMQGTGGTEMINGVRAALGYPEDSERNRYVLFLTDGQIGNENTILQEVRNTLGASTLLWSIGVGSSPNRHLLDGLAEEGRGNSFYVALQEDPGIAATRIKEQINCNYISNLAIDWGDLAVDDVFPEELPLLFPGEPLFIVGRYEGGGGARIKISGMIGDESWNERVRVELPFHDENNQAIASLWAREKIHQLERYILDSEDEISHNSVVDMITSTALTYQIVSNYTSFVAVSEEVRTDEQGNPINVEIPVNMPEGQSYRGTFGSSTGGLAPEAVGSTIITVADQRGMVLRDITSSVSVVSRDETRSMPVGSGSTTADHVSTNETFVSQERDQALTLRSGSTVSILSLITSSQSIDDASRIRIIELLLNAAADVYDNQSGVTDGMVIAQLTFLSDSNGCEVTIVQNFTESNEFEALLVERLSVLAIEDADLNGISIEVSIEFSSS